jgi:hypothetical protein
MIACKLNPGNPHAEEAVPVHVQLDELCRNDPLFKKQLTYLADLDAKKKKKNQKEKHREEKKSKMVTPPDPFKDFEAFLKKLYNIRQSSKVLFG